ncbi:tyrosine-protein phosphatase non-receptor type 4 isoform X1 [Hetaerina americana]|uniref:tyrosine-protein phosphatase non-receptor type 4 isoform X1 n=1 Tax=Hetaerina americana TaxID=62018 RepID=UPI003A7F113D
MIESVSRRAFTGSSGTYNVRASEVARDKRIKSTIGATVVFLDDSQQCFELEKRAKGQVLLELVFQHLELVEKDYFGLQFSENGSTSSTSDVMRWLDPGKLIKKQNRGGHFFFRVKFYVTDPSKLQEEYTRYHFFLQIRKDILDGRLQVPPSTACLLASYAVQSELGDYHPDEHGSGYLSEFRLIPGQSEEMEKKIAELHKLHKAQTPADAEFNFLDHAKRLDMYGVDLHRARVRDSTNKEIQIGVTSVGVVVFQNNIRINTFSWSKIVKISFKRKHFFLQLRRELSESYDTLLGFNMASYRSSKGLWKSCVEHHAFFRLQSPYTARRPTTRRFLFSLGSKFRYSGRTQYQTMEEGRKRGGRLERTFVRSPSKRLIRQSMPPLSSGQTSSLEEKVKLLVPPGRSSRAYDNKVTSLGAREPRKAWGEGVPSDDEGGFLERSIVDERPPFTPVISTTRAMAYADDDEAEPEEEEEEEESGVGRSAIYEIPPFLASQPRLSVGGSEESSLVTIRIRPDEQGRFGFNVKGGSDLEMPIIVSRVAPNTPADKCYPRLNEGDQVLFISGHDVAGMTHEQVVNLIRSSRDTPPGELALTVRPTVYSTRDEEEDDEDTSDARSRKSGAKRDEEQEEPAFQYVPDAPLLADGEGTTGTTVEALPESMLLLAEGLESGALASAFEQLHRKKPGLSTVEARRPENAAKNRYRDIAPYDSTRVILDSNVSGDYINANFVNMEIPGSGIINRYIATQGPLPNTVADFWQMVFESQSTLVVMLTALSERGRAKCHKYWPDMDEEEIEVPGSEGQLRISCISEEEDDDHGFAYREFELKNIQTGDDKRVMHMQYSAWPDHGVPEEGSQFLGFVSRVRSARKGITEPVIVHCSAGIGRTGVLILAETAICLIEAGEPVYPLDIVRTMRAQRAMMIQTASQYRFVCESVLKAYNEGMTKPLTGF